MPRGARRRLGVLRWLALVGRRFLVGRGFIGGRGVGRTRGVVAALIGVGELDDDVEGTGIGLALRGKLLGTGCPVPGRGTCEAGRALRGGVRLGIGRPGFLGGFDDGALDPHQVRDVLADVGVGPTVPHVVPGGWVGASAAFGGGGNLLPSDGRGRLGRHVRLGVRCGRIA